MTAPEHLVCDTRACGPHHQCGHYLVGPLGSASGDYVDGIHHVLPTGGGPGFAAPQRCRLRRAFTGRRDANRYPGTDLSAIVLAEAKDSRRTRTDTGAEKESGVF